MAAKTYFVAQGFIKDGRKLASAQTHQLRTAEDATARARRMADGHVGAVAFEQVADDETGELLEEPKVLFRSGLLPDDFGDD